MKLSASTRTLLFLCSFLVGIIPASLKLNPVSSFLSFILWTLLIISYTIRKNTIFCACILIIFGLLAGFNYTEQWREKRKISYPWQETITLSALIVSPPDIRQEKIFITIKPQELIGRSLKNQPASGLILVKVPRYPVPQYGDLITLKGIIEEPESFNGFNYPLYLERSGIYGVIHSPRSVKIVDHNKGSPLLGKLYNLRLWLERTIQQTLPEPESSFLAGILLGSKRAIPENIQEALKITGTTHIIAISGANITILLTILLQFLPIYKRRSQLVMVIVIGGFISVLTGASASVVRGALVAAFGSYLKLYSRKAWSTPFIATSMAILLIYNPLLLVADPGFQLSFAAFAGLVYLAGPTKRILEKITLSRNLPEVVKGSSAETFAATLTTAPFSLFVFGQVSLLGIIVNPLILWILPLVTFFGLALICLGWIHSLATLIRLPLWLLLHSVLAVIKKFSELRVGIITLP